MSPRIVPRTLLIRPTGSQPALEITDTTERFEELIPILENHALEYAIEGEPTAAEEFAEFIHRN